MFLSLANVVRLIIVLLLTSLFSFSCLMRSSMVKWTIADDVFCTFGVKSSAACSEKNPPEQQLKTSLKRSGSKVCTGFLMSTIFKETLDQFRIFNSSGFFLRLIV